MTLLIYKHARTSSKYYYQILAGETINLRKNLQILIMSCIIYISLFIFIIHYFVIFFISLIIALLKSVYHESKITPKQKLYTGYQIMPLKVEGAQSQAKQQLDATKVFKQDIGRDQKTLISVFFCFLSGWTSFTDTGDSLDNRSRDGANFIPFYHFHSFTNIQTFICNFSSKINLTYF